MFFSELVKGPTTWVSPELKEEEEFLASVPMKALVLIGTLIAILNLIRK